MRKKKEDWREKYKKQEKYDAQNAYKVAYKFNKNTDADIIQALESAPSKQGLVKEAIRFYLAHKDDFAE